MAYAAFLFLSAAQAKLGDAPATWLGVHRVTFFEVFGFKPP